MKYLVCIVLVQPFTTQVITAIRKRAVENIVGIGENAGNQHFLHFPRCFLAIERQISYFSEIYFVVQMGRVQNCVLFGKELHKIPMKPVFTFSITRYTPDI